MRYQLFNMVNDSFSYADQLSVGDEMLVPKNNEMIPAKVANVNNVTMQGNLFIVIHFINVLSCPIT